MVRQGMSRFGAGGLILVSLIGLLGWSAPLLAWPPGVTYYMIDDAMLMAPAELRDFLAQRRTDLWRGATQGPSFAGPQELSRLAAVIIEDLHAGKQDARLFWNLGALIYPLIEIFRPLDFAEGLADMAHSPGIFQARFDGYDDVNDYAEFYRKLRQKATPARVERRAYLQNKVQAARYIRRNYQTCVNLITDIWVSIWKQAGRQLGEERRNGFSTPKKSQGMFFEPLAIPDASKNEPTAAAAASSPLLGPAAFDSAGPKTAPAKSPVLQFRDEDLKKYERHSTVNQLSGSAPAASDTPDTLESAPPQAEQPSATASRAAQYRARKKKTPPQPGEVILPAEDIQGKREQISEQMKMKIEPNSTHPER